MELNVSSKTPTVVKVAVKEREVPSSVQKAPLLLQRHLKPAAVSECVHIQVNQATCVLPEQIQILQQQLRQHVQLATSSYLQLFVHPLHWSYASKHKEYLETFMKLVESNPKSVANVCNLKPAMELVTTWENTVSLNTPENHKMIQFIQDESDRCMRRNISKSLYVGDFHETFKKVVANSPVFLYPYLLPSMPFRGDSPGRRACYLQSEDELIALGLEQFWQYVLDNPSIYKPKPVAQRHHHWGLSTTIQLIAKYMFPWIPEKLLHSHITNVRKIHATENPIYKYFQTRTVPPLKHKLLPYNPQLTLYEQPEHEIPRIWVRYLAKTSKRFKNYMYKRTVTTGVAPRGVDVVPGEPTAAPSKAALPIDFTTQIVSNTPLTPDTPALADKFDIQITNNAQTQPPLVTNLYKFVETSTGAYLVPLTNGTTTVDSSSGPITTPIELNSIIANSITETSKTTEKVKENVINTEHCTCCILLRKILKQRQTFITEYFGTKKENKECGCREKRYPKVSNRLRLLVNNYKYNYTCALQALQTKIRQKKETKDIRLNDTNNSEIDDSDLEDIAYVTKFHLKLLTRTSIPFSNPIKKKVFALLSKFNPFEHDPLKLASQMDQIFGNQLVDMYKEFLGFLTPEQADKIDAFKDYFVRNCITDLVKKVEVEVTDAEKRHKILEELHRVFSKGMPSACEICTDILSTLDGYPKLAQYVHSLFPHRKEQTPEQTAVPPAPTPELPQTIEKPVEETAPRDDTTVIKETTANYEADHSMSEEEDNGSSKTNSESESKNDGSQPIKTENTSAEYVTPTSESVTLVVTVSKTEVQDFNECSNSSPKLMFEDEMVKIEGPEWKRDEDKLILEVLKEHLTPEERADKTIVETINEKNIIGMISESLTDKSKQEIKTRVLYLLQIC